MHKFIMSWRQQYLLFRCVKLVHSCLRYWISAAFQYGRKIPNMNIDSYFLKLFQCSKRWYSKGLIDRMHSHCSVSVKIMACLTINHCVSIRNSNGKNASHVCVLPLSFYKYSYRVRCHAYIERCTNSYIHINDDNSLWHCVVRYEQERQGPVSI